MDSVEIKILGKKYYFRSDDPEKLRSNAEYFEKQLMLLKSKFNTVDQSKLFVLYTLDLLERYFSVNTEKENLELELAQIDDLLTKVEIEK